MLKNIDFAASLDRAHSVSNDDNSSVLHGIFNSDLNLFLVCLVKGRSRLIEQQDLWLSNEGSSNCNTLLLSTGQFAALDSTLVFETFDKWNIVELFISRIDVTIDSIKVSLLLFLCFQLFDNVELLVVLFLANEPNNSIFLLFHLLEQLYRGVLDTLEGAFVNEVSAVCDVGCL